MTVQLALRKNDTRLTAKAIQWWTGSIYSHCELVVDGLCYSSSAMDGGVRSKHIYLDPEKWDVIDLPWVEAERVVSYFNKTDPYRYGYFGLIKAQLFNRGKGQSKTPFCSEWCAGACGIPIASSLSPHTLGNLVKWINSITPLQTRAAVEQPAEQHFLKVLNEQG